MGIQTQLFVEDFLSMGRLRTEVRFLWEQGPLRQAVSSNVWSWLRLSAAKGPRRLQASSCLWVSFWVSGRSVINFITFCGEWHLAVVMTKYTCHPLQHLRGCVWPHQHADSWMFLRVRVAGCNGTSFYTVWCWCSWLAIKFNWKLLARSEVKY